AISVLSSTASAATTHVMATEHAILRSLVCFFFSSRRRHTRCYRDWSSDVCSSDLGGSQTFGSVLGNGPTWPRERSGKNLCRPCRSEERRVGKEWRSRVWSDE